MAEIHNTVDSSLADSIAMLEQILEVMPHDGDALKAVYSAYKRIGNAAQAFEYLNRIVDVHIHNGDGELMRFLQVELPHFEDHYPSEVAAQLARLRVADHSGSNDSPSANARATASSGGSQQEADISEELALAWRLYEENQLSQEEYSSVLHDLTEVSSKELDVPISVLHVLNDRGFNQMNRIMNYLSSRSGAPCMTLSNFELSEELANTLSPELSSHDGALPFAIMGNDLLVAVLNPFNHMLVDKVESQSERRCHTFLAAPDDYDLALGKLRALQSKASPAVQP